MLIKMYEFTLPIGDESNDGHGQCTYFIVSSNKPVEEVRKIHRRIEEVTGINLFLLCACHECNTVRDPELSLIKGTGFKEGVLDADDEVRFDPDMMAGLWVHLLMFVDKELKLEVRNVSYLPLLDSSIGYGLFYT